MEIGKEWLTVTRDGHRTREAEGRDTVPRRQGEGEALWQAWG